MGVGCKCFLGHWKCLQTKVISRTSSSHEAPSATIPLSRQHESQPAVQRFNFNAQASGGLMRVSLEEGEVSNLGPSSRSYGWLSLIL
ncbi:hypothetical protein VNO77_27411 [Canavalia gladiata]|uniref:Uncharacterized protein n=1 Tax=Canavalia gladiata TaxID=3824 RepID=A0AAN9KUQ2_CANGL